MNDTEGCGRTMVGVGMPGSVSISVGPRRDQAARDIPRGPCLVEEWLGCDVARYMFTYLDGAGLFDAPRSL